MAALRSRTRSTGNNSRDSSTLTDGVSSTRGTGFLTCTTPHCLWRCLITLASGNRRHGDPSPHTTSPSRDACRHSKAAARAAACASSCCPGVSVDRHNIRHQSPGAAKTSLTSSEFHWRTATCASFLSAPAKTSLSTIVSRKAWCTNMLPPDLRSSAAPIKDLRLGSAMAQTTCLRASSGLMVLASSNQSVMRLSKSRRSQTTDASDVIRSKLAAPSRDLTASGSIPSCKNEIQT
mmetsp:Transcript_102259/g.234459  ORF Transcript_102259/g.234459 Transcript_102259/m.234459 type:complete len:235 (-) Transcript_102259:173-877(-)